MYEPIQEFEDTLDIGDYLAIVLRRKWLILTLIMASFLTSLFVSLAQSPLYKAKGKIELKLQSPRVTKFEDMAGLGAQLHIHEFMQTQLNLLQSETLADRVIDRLDLEHDSGPGDSFKKSGPLTISSKRHRVTDSTGHQSHFTGSVDAEQTEEAKLPDLRVRKSIEEDFARNLEVKPERDTMIFSLEFTSKDPARARDVLNALIEEYISWQVDKKIDAGVVAKQHLEKQIELARIELENAETRLNNFARKEGIVSLNSQLNLVYSQLEEANKAYATAQTERMNKEATYKKASEGGVTSAAVDNQLIQRLRDEYVAAAAGYKESSAIYKEAVPRVQILKTKMEDIQKRIKAEEDRILESVKNNYLTATMKEAALKNDTDRKKAHALELNDRLAQYKMLDREVETSKQIHQSLLERFKEIDAKVGTELGNIEVVDYAKLPLTPCSPRTYLNVFFATLIGLVLGLGLAFFLEYVDSTTIKKMQELSERFHLPVLGALPNVAEPDEVSKIGSLVRLNPTADFSEALRTAKVSIQLSRSTDGSPKSLLITSTAAGQGKSTVSVNLAQAFSSEEKVLLIDADLRKPNLHRLIGQNGDGVLVHTDVGLSSYLAGKSTATKIIRESGNPNLRVVFAGPIPPNPSELLSSKRMERFIAQVYKRYDRIIIDGPPAMGFADALTLSHYSDGVILVSILGQTRRETLQVFLGRLDNVGGRLIGAIVNKLGRSSSFESFENVGGRLIGAIADKLDGGNSLRRLLNALAILQPTKKTCTKAEIHDVTSGDKREDGKEIEDNQHPIDRI